MIISIIAAISKNSIIGNKNSLIWNIPEDLAWFKEKTMHSVIIMGRKTFESIGKKPLPRRRNIVLTKKKYIGNSNDIFLANSLKQALSIAVQFCKKEIFIIGGGEVYKIFLPLAHRMYLTHVDLVVKGNIRFPNYKKIRSWNTVYRRNSINFNSSYKYYFEILEDPYFSVLE